jgi:hypothetical protein
MNTLLLSLLLIVLIGIGLLMGRRVREAFENPDAAAPTAPVMSPALANLLATPALITATSKPISVDTLKRSQDITVAADTAAKKAETTCPQHECPKCDECKKCPDCPDMSKYIRIDEVPCWNCNLAGTIF